MTPKQKIKHAIILRGIELYEITTFEVSDINSETIDEIYEEFKARFEDAEQDAKNEIRSCGVKTGLHCEDARCYESDAVAMQMPDGSWVGWTYWYGGGKYGEPESIDWISDAYDVDCVEQEKTMIVRTFTKLSEL